MQKVIKYILNDLHSPQEIKLPESAKLLSVGFINGAFVIFALVSEATEDILRTLEIVATGAEMANIEAHKERVYIDTATHTYAKFEYHFFELKG